MKITTFVFLLSILVIGCSKPSYKKNDILLPNKDGVSKTSIAEAPLHQKLSIDQQIASAILAAPAEAREGAMVYGYSNSGEFMMLREGSNEFICIADLFPKEGDYQSKITVATGITMDARDMIAWSCHIHAKPPQRRSGCLMINTKSG